MSYLLGIDVGSSSVKCALLEVETGNVLAFASSPDQEMSISTPQPGWAEQDPAAWWEHARRSIAIIKISHASALENVGAIGISYQMHGLVCLDHNMQVVRPSIIWCDSRAVQTGEKLFQKIGNELALASLLNSPGNFTAAKLAWVKENEPEVFARIHKFCLPGDYIALQLTKQLCTTPSGLSEGILYDFQKDTVANSVLAAAGLHSDLLPEIKAAFSNQGTIDPQVATELGISKNAAVFFRAGDQLNNAFSLNVLNPGEVATTAGTSGVLYAVGDRKTFDPSMAVNTFLHVNHKESAPRYGTLFCLNGCGILYSWLRRLVSGQASNTATYENLNQLASSVPAGAEGLMLYPYGNGAERSLKNTLLGASLDDIDFSRHSVAHLARASQEGIAFAFRYGMEVIDAMYGKIKVARAGRANLFLSKNFQDIFSDVTNTNLELYQPMGRRARPERQA